MSGGKLIMTVVSTFASTYSSTRTLVVGFALIASMLAGIAAIAVYVLSTSTDALRNVVAENDKNMQLLGHMHHAMHKRIITLYHMATEEESGLKEALWRQFDEHGSSFAHSREALMDAQPNEQVMVLLDEQGRKLQPLVQLQTRIAVLLLKGELDGNHLQLIEQATEIQDEVLHGFHRVSEELYKQKTTSLFVVNQANLSAKYQIISLSFIALLLTLGTAHFVFVRVRGFEKSLKSEHELALVTLYSVADGVVILDRQGCIKEINAKGQALLGCDGQDIRGQCLGNLATSLPKEWLEAILGQLRHGEQIESADGVTHDWLELCSLQGELLTVEYSLSPVTINQEQACHVLVLHDITAIHSLTKKLDYEASHDSLTGLYNRRKFEDLLDLLLADARRYNEAKSWLCYIDLDNFKQVNDSCGHMAGDELLLQIAQGLKSAVRSSDHVARIGGDEFAVILRYSDVQEAVAAAERIRETIAGLSFTHNNCHFSVSASMGLVFLGERIRDINSALHHADVACYQAKKYGRNRVHVFDELAQDRDPS